MGELNKKKVIIFAIAALLLVTIIISVIIIANAKNNSQDGIATSSEFKNMKASDVTVEYNAENDTTYINFKVNNTSSQNIERETVNVMLLNQQNAEVAGVQITIAYIEANGEYKASISFLGDLNQVRKLSLNKPIQATN